MLFTCPVLSQHSILITKTKVHIITLFNWMPQRKRNQAYLYVNVCIYIRMRTHSNTRTVTCSVASLQLHRLTNIGTRTDLFNYKNQLRWQEKSLKTEPSTHKTKYCMATTNHDEYCTATAVLNPPPTDVFCATCVHFFYCVIFNTLQSCFNKPVLTYNTAH